MKDISGLVRSLNGYLGWNKARVTCFVHLLLSLLSVRTVNLQELAIGFGGNAQISSRYRRLQRFFSQFEMDFTKIARWIFKLFFREDQKFYLLMDRTNWYWGKKKINIFMLSIAYEGLAIPLFWKMLPKAGNSDFKERKALILEFIKNFGTQGIEGLLADREFGSGQFFKWLNKKNIPFYIRIKEGSVVGIKTKKFLVAKKLFKHLQLKKMDIFNMAVEIFGEKVYLAGARSERGELMIVATNKNPKVAIATYLRRWEIESLFQSLKGRGFNLEATHMTHLDRLAKLIAVAAVGLAWAHKVGEHKAEIKPILWKRFLNGQTRPQYSYFRYGLDSIREALLQIYDNLLEFNNYFKFILPGLEGNL